MKRNDILFRVMMGGELKQVVFVEESLAGPDCTVPTWLVRDACKRIRCSVGSYVGSEREAWEVYLKEVEEAVSGAVTTVENAEEELVRMREEAGRVQLRLMNLGAEVRVRDVFTCPICAAHQLEEVMGEVQQTTEVTGVALTESGVACEYGDCSHDGGAVIEYKCGVCGYVIANHEAGLVEYLRSLDFE